jgi:hypothetical protein
VAIVVPALVSVVLQRRRLGISVGRIVKRDFETGVEQVLSLAQVQKGFDELPQLQFSRLLHPLLADLRLLRRGYELCRKCEFLVRCSLNVHMRLYCLYSYSSDQMYI